MSSVIKKNLFNKKERKKKDCVRGGGERRGKVNREREKRGGRREGKGREGRRRKGKRGKGEKGNKSSVSSAWWNVSHCKTHHLVIKFKKYSPLKKMFNNSSTDSSSFCETITRPNYGLENRTIFKSAQL